MRFAAPPPQNRPVCCSWLHLFDTRSFQGYRF